LKFAFAALMTIAMAAYFRSGGRDDKAQAEALVPALPLGK
jgi:hypothetical protein